MKKLGIGLWLVLALCLTPVTALAVQTQTVSVPVLVYAEGTERDTESTLVLEDGETEVYRMTLKAGQPGALRLPCDGPGVWDFTLRQLPGQDAGCDYDRQVYLLRLYVTCGEDGALVPTALLLNEEGRKEPAAVFRNRWAAPAAYRVCAWKTLDGNTPEDGAFRFCLLSEDGETVLEAENRGRRVTFPELTFDSEGTWRFHLKEVAGENGKILYDRAVYTLTVTVTRDTDYQIEAVWERNGKPWSGTPSFANYTDTGSPKTGDSIGIWIAGLLISAAGLAGMRIKRRKKQ